MTNPLATKNIEHLLDTAIGTSVDLTPEIDEVGVRKSGGLSCTHTGVNTVEFRFDKLVFTDGAEDLEVHGTLSMTFLSKGST